MIHFFYRLLGLWTVVKMKRYEAYLFDVDGTLIDTAEMIYRCFVHSCRKFAGIDVQRAHVISNIGLPLRQQLEIYLGPLSDERAEDVMNAHMAYQLSIYAEYLDVFPTVREGLQELKDAGCSLAVVTSRRTQTLTLYLQETGLSGFFDVFVSPESTTQHKPHPAPVLKALELLGCESGRAIMVGDSAFDIECGANAGADTGFVTWSHNKASSLRVKPTYEISDLRMLARPWAEV